MRKYLIGSAFLYVAAALFQGGHLAQAQSLTLDQVTTSKAQVIEVLKQETKAIPGLYATSTYQTIKVLILEGTEKGQTELIDNDYLILSKGDVFYLRHTVNKLEGINTYSVADPYRLPTVYFFIGLFIVCVLIFGGKQGMRGLIALALSLASILYILLPSIINGYSPALVSIGVAALIIILGSYITHGFNRVTSSAVFGMIATVIVSGLLAYAAIHFGRLSGFATEEAIYLNMDTHGSINFAGLLLGGIIISLLGVLYDAAIGQAVSVDELHHVAPHLPRLAIFKSALRIGREHIGALVNILAIAYVGASLPLLLLFYQSSGNASLIVNQEIFSTEIIRAMVGSIGLVLAVPITTLIAVTFLIKKSEHPVDDSILKKEKASVESMGHHH
ncbi:MAG: hypothetical protein JWO00_86 [Candidatus Parcubacteria bacterium]|nr:hypothetical protein [Candidatus Parcubacteria bacterium]